MARTENTGRRRLLIAGAVAAAVLLVLAGFGLLALGQDTSSPTPDPDPTPTPTAGQDDPGASACGLAPGPDAAINSAPDTTWTLSGRVAAPSSDAAGPAADEGSIHTCFARGAVGALFSAANFAADVQNPEADTTALLEQRLVKDDRYAEALEEGVGSGAGGAGGEIQIAGFRIDSLTPDAATLQLVMRADDGPQQGALVAITYNLRWSEGDWKVVLPPEGQATGSQLSSLSGYVVWSGM